MDFLDLKDNDETLIPKFTKYLEDYSIGFYYDDFIDFLFVDNHLERYFNLTNKLTKNCFIKRTTINKGYFESLKQLLNYLYEIYSTINISSFNFKSLNFNYINTRLNLIKSNSNLIFKIDFEDLDDEKSNLFCLYLLQNALKVFLNIFFFLIDLKRTIIPSKLLNKFIEFYNKKQSQISSITPPQFSSKKTEKIKEVFLKILNDKDEKILFLKEIIYSISIKNICSETTDLKLINRLYIVYDNDYENYRLNFLIEYLNELLANHELPIKYKEQIQRFLFKIIQFQKAELLKEDFIEIFLNNFSHYLDELFWNCDYFSKFIETIWKDEFPEDFFKSSSGGHNKPRIKKVIRKY